MKKQGFTLVELLGVIIVMGILSTITTIIVSNIIEKSKINSVISSAEQIIRTATLDYTTNDNFTTDKQDILSLELSGKTPEYGYIQFNENEKARFYMAYNGYCVVKRYDSELEAFKMDQIEICDWYTSSKTIRLETTDSVLTVDDLESSNILNYRIYGNSYQETRSGKNLFNIDNVVNNTNMTNNNDGTITVSYYGARTVKTLQQLCPKMSVGDTITFSMVTPGYKQIYLGDGTYWGNDTTKTVTQSMLDAKVYFYTDVNDKTTPITISKIQFEKGTKATEYEEYGAMPSDEFPSKIHTLGTLVSDENDANYGKYKIDINLRGKNLFDLNSATITGATIEDDTIVGTENSINIDLYLKKGTYSIIFNTSKSNVFLRKGQVSNGYFSDMSSGKVTTFTFTEDEYLRISYFGVGGTISNIMLLEGSYTKDTMPEYEPYSSKTYSIYLDEPLRCTKKVCDYIDFENKMLVRNVGTKKFDGTENWYQYGSNVALGSWAGKVDKLHLSTTSMGYLSNIAKATTTSSETLNNNTFITHNHQNVNWIVFHKNILVDDWKDYLEEQSNNGVPVEVIFQLEKPIESYISLPQIKVFEGTNNITVTGGNLNASKIEVVAIKK